LVVSAEIRWEAACQKADGKYSGINKPGQIMPIDSRLSESLDRLQARAFLADGEITDSHFYLWDLLGVNDTDLRTEPYEIRYAHPTRHFRGLGDILRVCETAMTRKAKRDFVKKMHEANAEGFVCKNRDAAYTGGRAGQHFKCKFVATASFIVGPKPDKKADDGHRSIAVYLLDGDRPRFMGTVGVPDGVIWGKRTTAVRKLNSVSLAKALVRRPCSSDRKVITIS
jgi:ATP-dependent DNA ligase